MEAIGLEAIGLEAIGVEDDGVLVVGFDGVEGVIGVLCAHTGAAIARAAAMATPVRRCFMLLVLCGSSGIVTTRQRRAYPRAPNTGFRLETTHSVVSFRRKRNLSYRVSGPVGAE